MDDKRSVISNGNVLVRAQMIAAVWSGDAPPPGVITQGATVIELGPDAYIFPGLINLHCHPFYSVLPLWPLPTSHIQTAQGRPTGSEPYGNRYQWNTAGPEEYNRLVNSPSATLTRSDALGLSADVVKYAEIKALLGGETTIQGAPTSAATDNILARNVDATVFGRNRIQSRVPSVTDLNFVNSITNGLLKQMREGQVDAWLVHLAEGVRDVDRRPDDTFSSRAEFRFLYDRGLINDMTAIVHGTALEPEDFATMRAAGSIRTNRTGDGLGAKLIWSPLSNLLLYQRTTLIYHALNNNVLVSLSTDWNPSGSRNLLGELKIASIALRDTNILGAHRGLVPSVSIGGKSADATVEAEKELDYQIVSMVTRNPAKTVRWYSEVGSIEAGKYADLFVMTKPMISPTGNLPASPYRALIDAVERDIRLVLVDGEPLAGDATWLVQLKPGDFELVTCSCFCRPKAIDVTKDGVPQGNRTLAVMQQALRDGLAALGGDNPPPEGGPADASNTYHYLKARFLSGFLAGLSDSDFRTLVLLPNYGTNAQGRLNIERIELAPFLVEQDDFFFASVGADRGANNLINDPSPPFRLYPANSNHILPSGNPLSRGAFRDRWYAGRVGVQPTLRMESVSFQLDGSLSIKVSGEAGLDYRLEFSTNLVNWIPLSLVSSPAGVAQYIDHETKGRSVKFYRAHCE